MYKVVKPRLPDLSRYLHYLEGVHERVWLTNFGPLHQELTERLEEYLGVENLLLVSNGTLALHVAYQVFGLSGRVLTTPFSFVATASSLIWEGLEPVFVDVDRDSLNIDPNLLDEAGEASGIVGVHVYGNPCEVDVIEEIANARGVPVIYDAAHAFGSSFRGESLLRWGDAATLSFHATKLFHTIEGGAIIFRDRARFEQARSLINFGFYGFGSNGEALIRQVGINAKLSEYQAAAGLALLDSTAEVIERRSALVFEYQKHLAGAAQFQRWHPEGHVNGAYMPILLRDEAECLQVKDHLMEDGIETRRYFYPSLNRLDYCSGKFSCPVSEDAASRVLCLPLYSDLLPADARHIAERVKAAL